MKKLLGKEKTIMILVLAMILIMSFGGCGKEQGTDIRIGAMKGPTTIGLLSLMEESENWQTGNTYTFTIATAADELTPLLVKGELDIALLPANVAAVLYQKTGGGISVIDINTLGVLYMVSGNGNITDFEDLKGQTIYLTGKGTTPDLCLQYLLSANGIGQDEVTLDYRSEATEVAALLAESPDAVGLLPQPFVTVACMQNEKLSVCLSMTDEWEKVQGEGGSSMVTGVTVVRNEFLAENPEAVKLFLEEHADSTAYVESNTEKAAALCVAAGIIAKEPVAQKAIPFCNITCLTGEEMKQALSGYLKVLYDMNPEAVGGSLPAEDFYYLGK
ncbi:MAG: ABC transporter substrate-binding protein [Lachnospiraceae bacterium]